MYIMRATGIVRRLDDLGRIVIPKEIRRTMQLHESDPMEIFTDNDGKVILKKYSPLGHRLEEEISILASALGKAADLSVIITDTDNIVSHSGFLAKRIARGNPSFGPAITRAITNTSSETIFVYNNLNNGDNKEHYLIDIDPDAYPPIGSQCIIQVKDTTRDTTVGTVIILTDNQRLLSEQIAQATLAADLLAVKASM